MCWSRKCKLVYALNKFSETEMEKAVNCELGVALTDEVRGYTYYFSYVLANSSSECGSRAYFVSCCFVYAITVVIAVVIIVAD